MGNYSETTICKTPHGGVKMVATFFDKEGNPCDKKECVSMEISEYDENDVVIFSIISHN